MKKLLIVILAVALLFGGFLTWKNYTPKAEPEEAQETAVRTVDLDALYAAHDPDEVVVTVGDHPVTWDKYYYFLRSNINYIQQMFAYYGEGETDWSMIADETTGETMGQSMNTMAKESIKELYASVDFAEKNGAGLTEAQKAEIAGELAAMAAQVCGEGATEADFDAYLGEMCISRELYDMMVAWNYLDTNTAAALFGENGEKISDEEALAYLAENQLSRANHILFLTRDMSTGEELEESVKAEKLAQAQAVAEELRAAESTEALLALFAEKKQALDEDSGKTTNPDGYIVYPGAGFVAEFLDTALSLADYQVSDPVETVYGYHVILRLPLGADEIVDAQNGLSARQILVSDGFAKQLNEFMATLECEYADGFTPVDVAAFVR